MSEHKIDIPDEWLVRKDGRRFVPVGWGVPHYQWIVDYNMQTGEGYPFYWAGKAISPIPRIILQPVELTGIDWLRWAAEHRPGEPFEVQHNDVMYRLAVREHRFVDSDPPHIEIIMLTPRADIITRNPNNGGAIFLSLVKHGLDPSVLCDANVTWLVSERRGEE